MTDNIAYPKTYNRKVDSFVVQTLVFYLGNLDSNLDCIMIFLFML